MTKLLKRAKKQGTPLIDGDTVTFIWQGEKAPALIADFGSWEEEPFELQGVQEELWVFITSLPNDAYIEYAFFDPQDGKRLPDPFNPHTTPDGFGHTNNFFYMPGAAPSPLIHRQPGVPKGWVRRYFVDTKELAVGRRRAVYLYHPPVETPTPLLVVFDGQDYRKRGKLPRIVDNLIYQERIAPISLAMVANERKARTVEYACNEATLGFLHNSVLPIAREELNLIEPEQFPGAYGVMGASMGGLMALFTGLRLPDVFGGVLSQSGAFDLDDHDPVVFDLIQLTPVRPLKIWMDVGKYDFLISSNQRMHSLLVDRGYEVAYREYPGGHNYPSWRDDLWRGLEFIYPPGFM